MANGGGPACLRMRMALSEEQIKSLHQGIILTKELYLKLKDIIEHYYIQDLNIDNFFDQHFLNNTKLALEEIAKALDLDGV